MWMALAWTLALLPVTVEGQERSGSEGAGAPASVESPELARTRVFAVEPAGAGMEVDAHLVEEAWSRATPIALPWEITPGDNTPARFTTDCRVTFDDAHLYLGCVALDPEPASIRAYVTDRDGIVGNHDRISFLVDPFNDARRGWVFEISALGVQADLVYDERTSVFDASWDAIWSSAGRITEDGFVVEAAIPFRSLRFPSNDAPQTWRFWINRMRPRNDLVVMRSNTRLRNESCQLCQAHALHGLEGMDPGRNVELVPTLTATRTDSRRETFPAGPLVDGPVGWEPGFDARWSVTTDLTLNGTVNPDFSQVEADAPQLAANNRFALFFPEKRPFFLEAAELFATPLQAVFTRTIADPVAGVKFTGKSGAHAVGVLVARDRLNSLLIPGDVGSRRLTREQDVTTTILRYRRDAGEAATIGGLVTARADGDGYENGVGGLDVFLRPAPPLTLNVQVLASRTRYSAGVTDETDQRQGRFGGSAYLATAAWDTGDWGVMSGLNLRSAGFRADAGFVPQVGVRSVWGNVARTFWGGEEAFFTRLSLRAGFWQDRSTADHLVNEGIWSQVDFQGPMQSNGWLNPWASRELFGGRTYDLRGLNAGVSFRPWRDLGLGMNGSFGDAIDFRNERPARSVRLNPRLDLRLGRNVELEVGHSLQRLSVAGEEVLTENAGQLRSVYNLSPRAFLRGTLQYRRTSRNPETNPGLGRPLEEGLFLQALFSYKVNPLTVVFVGISDDRAGFTSQEGPRVDLTPRDRSFFLKLGWAWRP